MTDEALLAQFLAGAVDNRSFRHADHVRVAFALLARHDFPAAAALFCDALKAITARAGKPEAYHETMTIAFLSLIAERRAVRADADFESFAAANADLFDKAVLTQWYAPERLASDIARRTFVLPQAAP